MGGDPRRVAGFERPGPATGPAVEARFDAIGGDGPAAAPVATFAGLGTGEDPDRTTAGAGPDGDPAADDPGAPDGPPAAVARLGEAGGADPAVAVAELDVPDAPGASRGTAVRTARLGAGGRGRVAPGGGRAAPEPDAEEGTRGGRRPRRRAGTRPGPPDTDRPAGPGPERGGDRPSQPEPADAAGEGRPRDGARRGWGPKQIDPDADPLVAAREICLRLLTDRARTRHELARALAQRGVPDDAAESVLSRFDEVGLIDDAAFAGQYVRSRHSYRGLSRRAIAMELRRKGVDDEVAGEALEEVDPASEEQRARELVDRKLRTVPADTPEQRRKAVNRLVGMLARKGYGGGVAYRVVREALAAHGADAEELGDDHVPD
ncbi:regulatory protein RecX [Pseudonocardia hydrocarbonoxydans]|uniref:Regulatory protein RecX n=1 Tax=Pseudonocardia hydrocarbonoxydans TaxID=76726 RepID=A0A4Y3WKZ8_9PSEU|nr:regulatory protein RecX [Pseudonocardia hydrocarbonoxydans]GEC19627.1 hypothetical protein PHY01_19100 [Pseudonocardia hydrocarbonoxydans]